MEVYERVFSGYRDSATSILEIGIQKGGSLICWRDWFTNANVTGIDIDPDCSKHASERISVEIGDQTDVRFLTKVANKYGPFDIVIDDGSHVEEHQIASFGVLFQYVKPGGIFVIEDTCCSYKEEWTSPAKPLRSFLLQLFDYVNLNGESFTGHRATAVKEIKKERFTKSALEVDSVFLLKNLIIINKASYL